MPKTIQAQNTFKDRFFVDIAQRKVFIVQFLDSFTQKSGVTKVCKVFGIRRSFSLVGGFVTPIYPEYPAHVKQALI